MSMTLQTLALRPPMAAGAAARRLHRHALPLSLRATRLHPAPPPLAAKPLLFSRLAAAGSDQADSSGDREGAGSAVVPWVRWFLDLVATNIIPFSLISGIILGLANPTLGCIAHRWSLPKFSTFGIFFISGLTLRSREIGAAVEAWPAGMFGLGSILLLTPLFSKLILQIHLDPQEFVTGLAIFCCMPTTLSTGIALTQLVGGNSALALAMTVMSNMLCIVTKTLPVLVAVVEQLRGSLGEPGLLVLPCVASHIIQVIIDSFIVNWWLRKDRLEIETKEV